MSKFIKMISNESSHIAMEQVSDIQNTFDIATENINFFFNDDNIEWKVDEWKTGKTKILIVLGLSGSGKSTLGKKLAEEYNATYFELDFFNQQLKKEHPELATMTDKKAKNIKELEYTIKAIGNKRAVLDGASLARCGFDVLKKYSFIILGTSFLTSTYRATTRAFKDTDRQKKFLKDPDSKLELAKSLIGSPYGRYKANDKVYPAYKELISDYYKHVNGK